MLSKRGILLPVSYVALLLIFSSLFQACVTPSIMATKEQNAGDAMFNQHRYQEAIIHFDKMLDASRKLGIYRSLPTESEVCRKVANSYEMLGKYATAMSYVRRAMELDSAAGNLLGKIENFRHEGKIYIYMGSYYNGIRSLEKSLSLSEGMDQSLKNTNRLSIADTYLALGQLYAVMGRSGNAMKYTEQARVIFRDAGDSRGEMESYLTLGTVFTDQGDILTARKLIENSLKIAWEKNMGTARHYQLLATISSSLGEYEDALRSQEKALEEAQKYGIAAQIIWATIGMGDIYRELGDPVRAGKYYDAAKESRDTISMIAGSLDASLGMRMGDVTSANRYFSSEGSLTGRAVSSLRIAEIMSSENKTDSAVFYLALAGQSFRSAGNVQGLSNVQLLLGKLYIDNGNPVRAGNLLDSALFVTEFPETVWQAYFQKGRMYELMGDDDRAIDAYRNSVSVIEKIRGSLTIDEFKSSFFNSKREVYDRLINILMKNNRLVEAFEYSEQARARAFYDILANRKIDFRGSLPGDLISQEQEKRIEMQKLYKLLQRGESAISNEEGSRASEIRQIKDALTRVQAEYGELLQKIKLNNPAYADMVSVQPVSPADLQSRLDPSTAMLAYWLSDDELFIWLVKNKEITGRKIEVTTSRLSSLVENTRRAIQSNDEEASKEGLAALYRLLIYPVEDKLGGINNLVIIPNGPLHFIPFQALINPGKEFLVQKYNLVYSPSAGVYIICNDRMVKTGSRFFGLALSDIPVEGKAGLPGTDDELRKILPLFPENISAFGNKSTETFVKKNISGNNFIHFATHGSYNYRQPLYSCLLFPQSEEDDGRLNVFEVFEMNLNAKLVTLSACETGLGNISQGDELTGLSRAFLFAGSSSVIVSLWAVADYPTSLLMSYFYKYFKDHSMQEALTLAQRDVIKIYPQPVYWSPFVLIGNGSLRAD
jgi:CHAT domain-containing protein/Tfp pilus assembly protein PilF